MNMICGRNCQIVILCRQKQVGLCQSCMMWMGVRSQVGLFLYLACTDAHVRHWCHYMCRYMVGWIKHNHAYLHFDFWCSEEDHVEECLIFFITIYNELEFQMQLADRFALNIFKCSSIRPANIAFIFYSVFCWLFITCLSFIIIMQ